MLLENQINFNVINRMDDWSKLETIIIPSATQLNQKIVNRLKSFTDRGGKLLIMGKSILNLIKIYGLTLVLIIWDNLILT